jgi:hypothetical protein
MNFRRSSLSSAGSAGSCYGAGENPLPALQAGEFWLTTLAERRQKSFHAQESAQLLGDKVSTDASKYNCPL